MTAPPAFPHHEDLNGTTVLITGAGSGIGRATALLLGARGAHVVCTDVTDAVQDVGAEITGAGGEASAYKLDVSDRTAVGSVFAEVMEARGQLDGLVTSAGVMLNKSIAEMDEAALDRVLNINLKGTLWCCQAAAPIMTGQGRGSIVTLSSAVFDQCAPTVGAYAMSKGAVVALTRTLAHEMAPANVRVNAIAPGMIMTGITARHFTRPDGTVDEALRAAAVAKFSDLAPIKRIGDPDEIAYAALYLLSGASTFVTGQVLRVNGGMFMG